MHKVVLWVPEGGLESDVGPNWPVAQLTGAGWVVLARVRQGGDLVHAVTVHAPDGVVVVVHDLDEGVLATLKLLLALAPCPVLLVTQDALTDWGAAAAVGVHDWVDASTDVASWSGRLHWAAVRFRREQKLLAQCDELERRWQERVSVDKAKGLLMQSRALSDEQAFRLLRETSMNNAQRLGELAKRVIGAAQQAERVNRCAQLRMLSQRLVKWHLLAWSGHRGADCRTAVRLTTERIQDTLLQLASYLEGGAHMGALAVVQRHWQSLEQAIHLPVPQGRRTPAPSGRDLMQLDACAERLMEAADQLTTLLHQDGDAASFSLLNTVGRQRMLSQRYAKLALLRCWSPPEWVPPCTAEQAATRTEFERVLRKLNRLPLTNADIQTALATAGGQWMALVHANERLLPGAGRGQPEGSWEALLTQSEAVLDVFEQLSHHYESSLELLLG